MTLHRSWLLAISPMESAFFAVANSMSPQNKFFKEFAFLKILRHNSQ
jgi:hypothetical protein